MIRIFNRKLGVNIRIEDNKNSVRLNPRDYEERPFVSIELNGFDMPRHASTCKDCQQFINAFGIESVDWYVEYLGKINRIDTSYVGKEFGENNVKYVISQYFTGTKINLVFHSLPIEKDRLQAILDDDVRSENYERACIIRDLLIE